MRALLIGHLCHPDHGSEAGVTWNWAWELSRYHDVWLVAHPYFREAVERYLEQHPNDRFNITWVSLPRGIEPWRPENGERWIRLHYILWQLAAQRAANALHRTWNFDVVHQMSWSTVSAPPRSWRLGPPFIWGPVGGGQTSPRRLLRYFRGARLRELLRTVMVLAAPYFPSLRSTVRNSALILATNYETSDLLRRAGATDVRIMSDAGIARHLRSPAPSSRVRERQDPLILLWIGRLEERKALKLALDALCRAIDVPVELTVIGDGSMRDELISYARTIGIGDRVRFVGGVQRHHIFEFLRSADLLLFTSLRDSSGTVLLEAMANGRPVLTLDHQGARVVTADGTGIRVPVTTPDGTVDALADAIRLLAHDPQACRQMGLKAWEHSELYTWDSRALAMHHMYEEVTRRR